MIVLCNGMPRSASTWSFNVCRLLFLEHQPQDSLYARYHENLAEVIAPLEENYAHLVIKCHTLDAKGRELCISGKAAAIYTHRDPYDAICSAMMMFNHPFEDALEYIRRSLELFEFHRQTGKSHIIAYDGICERPLDAISGIAKYLGFQPNSESLDRVAAETSIDAMKAIASQVGKERPGIQGPRSMYDPETNVHRNHIRDGSSGYGRTKLSVEQLRRAEEVLKHYPAATGFQSVPA